MYDGRNYSWSNNIWMSFNWKCSISNFQFEFLSFENNKYVFQQCFTLTYAWLIWPNLNSNKNENQFLISFLNTKKEQRPLSNLITSTEHERRYNCYLDFLKLFLAKISQVNRNSNSLTFFISFWINYRILYIISFHHLFCF